MADKVILPGTTVSFQDTSNETDATYMWDFGVGEGTTIVKNPTHTYNNVGLYTVTHSVTNSCGTTTCSPKTIQVSTTPQSETNPAIYLMGAAVLGFLIMSKKK